MILDFSVLEETIIYNQYGGDGPIATKLYCDQYNRIMECRIFPGSSLGEHTHHIDSEMVFVKSGRGYVVFDGQREILKPGTAHYCPKGHTHKIVCSVDATEPLVCNCIISRQ